jgi:serine/threonine protein kinase
LAPELIEVWPAYDVACDTWSFGVLLFVLLGGYEPFSPPGSNDVKKVFELTRNGQYHFHPKRWQGISKAAKDLIARCLTVKPNSRISTKAALAHEWMSGSLTLPSTMISAVSLAITVNETKRPRKAASPLQRDDEDIDRLKELNDVFAAFLEERAGSSFVSALTGIGRPGTVSGAASATGTCFPEDSLKGKPFSHFYSKETQLGQGGFATVFRCVHKSSGLFYAVKQVDSSKSTKAATARLNDEINVLKFLRGAPYIIRLYDVFEEGHMTYLVMEEMRGGDLLHRILEKEAYTEREARYVCKALFSAVNFCHKQHIAHRDIKLENLLLQEHNNDASIKLADFGFAKKVRKGSGLRTMLGTPAFMAPEIYDTQVRHYDERCDLWSVGVVVYTLLGGYLPFEGEVNELSQLVMRGEYRFHDEYWRDVSQPAKKLITSLLQVKPKNRLTMEQSLSARWITVDDAELSVMDLSTTKSRMQNMVHGKGQLKSASQGVSSTRRSERKTRKLLTLHTVCLLQTFEASRSQLGITDEISAPIACRAQFVSEDHNSSAYTG